MALTEKLREFLLRRDIATPYLVVDLDIVEARYLALSAALAPAEIYYAVKANPARQILARLRDLGACFDAASMLEIRQCLEAGIPPGRIAFGNSAKKARDIAEARERGIDLFAYDSRAEMRKLAAAAPGARVYCRIFMEPDGAEWPLSRKFGCPAESAADFLEEAGHLGLVPAGVSFHVGSQQRFPARWDVGIERAARIFSELERRSVALELLNIGGGFPARYRDELPALSVYADEIHASLARHFGGGLPRIVAEPGRGVVGDAGVIQTEIVLVADESREPDRRWVFLDVGKFGGLPETFAESIRYRIRTPHDGGPAAPAVLAGPTCDEVDVLYDAADYHLPTALGTGDRIEILATGAYTATYASIGFNGFPPLGEHYI